MVSVWIDHKLANERDKENESLSILFFLGLKQSLSWQFCQWVEDQILTMSRQVASSWKKEKPFWIDNGEGNQRFCSSISNKETERQTDRCQQGKRVSEWTGGGYWSRWPKNAILINELTIESNSFFDDDILNDEIHNSSWGRRRMERDIVVVAKADGSGANVTMRDNNYIKSHWLTASQPSLLQNTNGIETESIFEKYFIHFHFAACLPEWLTDWLVEWWWWWLPQNDHQLLIIKTRFL